MRDIIQVVLRNKLLDQSQEALDDAAQTARDPLYTTGRAGVYRASCRYHNSVLYVVGRNQSQRTMLALSKTQFSGAPFGGKPQRMQGVYVLEIPMTSKNAVRLWDVFPFTRPVTSAGSRPSIGFGDRLGNTTPAHIRVAKRYDLFPVLAQQSVRELTAVGKTFDQTVANASFAVFQEGYTDGYGADADHIREMSDVKQFAKAEPSMMTLDIGEFVRSDIDELDNRSLQEAFRKLPKQQQQRVRKTYSGRTFNLGGVSVRFRPGDAERCAVMFSKAIQFAEKAYARLNKVRGGDCTIEFTVDEIPVESRPVDHYFIASELAAAGVAFYSIAFRLPGKMQKGIDYNGDVRAFRNTFAEFAGIATALGTHRISVHSGSDKFALYSTIARSTEGRFHLKTSGTSWLVAIRTIANVAPELYRKIHEVVMDEFPKALARYEIDADVNNVPALDSVRDRQLPGLLDNPDWRQLVHISYGGVLQNESLRAEILEVLHREEEAYFANIAKHFGAHLDALGVPSRNAS